MTSMNEKIIEENYSWNRNLLLSAKRYLSHLPKSQAVNREEILLTTFLSHEDSSITITQENFQECFKRDKESVVFDYYEYLSSIFYFLDNNLSALAFNKYSKLNHTPEEVFTKVHDYYKDLDDEWFKIFDSLYINRKNTFSLSESRPYSVYLPICNIWLASTPFNKTVEDYTNMVHEYAHGIVDVINSTPRNLTSNNILIELFPMVNEMIFMDSNHYNNIVEKSKYLLNTLNTMITYSKEILIKNRIFNEIVDIKNARNLSRVLKRKKGFEFSKGELIDLFSNPADEAICYVYNFLVAIKLTELYKKDKDLFKFDMNKIITSTNDPKDTLKELKLLPQEKR